MLHQHATIDHDEICWFHEPTTNLSSVEPSVEEFPDIFCSHFRQMHCVLRSDNIQGYRHSSLLFICHTTLPVIVLQDYYRSRGSRGLRKISEKVVSLTFLRGKTIVEMMPQVSFISDSSRVLWNRERDTPSILTLRVGVTIVP